MAISPYSTPLQYEYKPLNLSGFITPLSNMQEKFDITTAQVEEAKDLFNVAHLPFGTDPEKAKELIAIAQGKVDELAQNLATTKNYKQATSKLKELNNLWNKDPHRQALEGEAKRFEEAKKRELARVESGKKDSITAEQYQQWLNREVRNYENKGGASFKADYSNEAGDWNRITGDTGRIGDKEEELQDLKLKIGAAVKADASEGYYKSIGIDMDTFNKHFAKTNIKELTGAKLEQAIEGFLLTQPRFSKWGRQVADYNFDSIELSENFNDYAKDILTRQTYSIDNALAERKQELKNAKKSEKDDTEYQSLLKEKESLQNTITSGKYNTQEVKDIYTQQHLNRILSGDATADIFKYKEKSTSERSEKIDKDSDEGRRLGMYSKKDVRTAIADQLKNMTYDAKSDYQVVTSNAKTLYNILGGDKSKGTKGILDISGGAMRTLVLGEKGSKQRASLEKNAGEQYNRAQTVYTAAVNSKGDYKTFVKKLKASGIDINEDAAKKVFNNLNKQGSDALTELRQNLENGQSSYSNYVTAKENVLLVEKATLKDKDFQTFTAEVGKDTPMFNSKYRSPSDITNTYNNHPEIAKLFDPKTYSKEDLKRLKIDSENKSLSFDDVAKLKGYKNYGDAIIKGYSFGGIRVISSRLGHKLFNTGMLEQYQELSPIDIKNKFTQEVGQKGLSTQKMAYELINTPKVSGELAEMFATTGKLQQQIGATELKGLPGFDKNGDALSGTNVIVEGKKAPHIVVHGQETYFNVSYTYLGEDGKARQGQVITKALPSQKKYLQTTYQNMIKDLETKDDPVSKETLSTVKAALFNTRFGSNINNVNADAKKVENKPGRNEVDLGNIVIPDEKGRPSTITIVKKAKEDGAVGHYYTVRDATGAYRGRYDSIEQLKVSLADY
jgi:hypothetical protein